MTVLNFTHRGQSYTAEVTLGRDLQLDEVIEVRYTTPSGAQYEVADTTQIETVIEREVSRRKAELSARRDELRSASRSAYAMGRAGGFALRRPDQRVADAVQSSQPVVKCTSQPAVPSPAQQPQQPSEVTATQKERCHVATFTLKNLNQKGNRAFYTCGRHRLAFSVKAFVDGAVPQTIEVDAPLTVPKPKPEPKPKLTAEEKAAIREQKKAERAANPKPKPTKAEKIAALQARIAKLSEQEEL